MPHLRAALLLAVLASSLAAPSASAAELNVPGILDGGVGTNFHPPDATGTATEAFTSDVSLFTLWVDERGTYTFDSGFVSETFDGRVLLYRGPLAHEAPLDRLIAVSDFGPLGERSFEVLLEAGVIYQVVTVFAVPGPHGTSDFGTTISGPGEPRRSACIPPEDHPHPEDAGEALALGEQFCVYVEFTGRQGLQRFGTAVPYRSFDSGAFWFFHRDNWELLVKVLDGCAVNGHYWVFLAAATNVEFDLFVDPRHGDLGGGRHYHNDLGHRADAVTDTAAFACADVPDF
jgi:hypothetical protein